MFLHLLLASYFTPILCINFQRVSLAIYFNLVLTKHDEVQLITFIQTLNINFGLGLAYLCEALDNSKFQPVYQTKPEPYTLNPEPYTPNP